LCIHNSVPSHPDTLISRGVAGSGSRWRPKRSAESSPGRISAVGWSASARLDYRGWALEGRRIGLMCRASPWWIGDWLLYGTATWGERYAAAARITGYDPKSLRNMRYVASRVDLSLRRDDLTWSHHALLASLDADRQRKWLERARRERLSVEDLRLELRAEQSQGLARGHAACALPDPGERTVICPNCGDRVRIP
jgi:hypothetical protein